MEALLQDVRYAARRLVRNPGFTLVAVLTLALGIGANSAIFSVVNAVLLRPLPFGDPELLDQVYTTHEQHGNVPSSPPDFLQMQEETRAYEALAAYTLSFPNLTGEDDPVRLSGTTVSASFFEVLDVQPQLGRVFTEEENEPGRHRVALLSHALWQQRFGGTAEVVGRTIQLNGEPFEVVGVMPAGFDYPAERELWTPLEYTAQFRDDGSRLAHFLSVIGRRRPGVSVEEGAADIQTIAGRIKQEFPAKAQFSGTALRLRDEMVGEIRTPLLVLLGAVGLVLLIACVNVANLLLARAAAREGEFAIRTALGAGRGRLVRQLLTESMLLALLGGAAGLLLSVWGTDWLLGLQPEGIPRLDEVGVDWAVVGFTGAIALLTGVLFGLVPAYGATRGNLVESIKEGGRGGQAGRSSTRLRGVLVVIETALAVMLLAGAGLMIRSFVELRAVDPGFRTDRALAFDLALPAAAYPENEQVRSFYEQLADRLRALPGVEATGAATALPMSDFFQRSPLRVEGQPHPRPGEDRVVEVRTVTPSYLGAMGVPVLRGRSLQDTDRAESPPVVLLTQAAAERFFPGEDPVGRRVTLGFGPNPNWAEVVGIVGDVKNTDLADAYEPGIYRPHAQYPSRDMSLVLRGGADPMQLVSLVRREVQSLDPNLPLFNVRTLEEVVSQSVSQPRFYMLLLSIFAGSALLLAAIGIFGVMSYMVVQRTREIGIRMALGAAPRSVLRLIVGSALALALGGVAVGLGGALLGSRLLSGLLFGVAPSDPATLASVALLLTTVAFVASYLPARRATRVDPMVALRAE